MLVLVSAASARLKPGNTKGGKYHCTVNLLFDWFEISCMTTDNFCFRLQNRLIQTSQTGGQQYSDTSPFSIPCSNPWTSDDEPSVLPLSSNQTLFFHRYREMNGIIGNKRNSLLKCLCHKKMSKWYYIIPNISKMKCRTDSPWPML